MEMFKGFLSILKQEFIRLFTSPRLLLFIFIVPVAIFFYYSKLMYSGVPRDLPVVLCDQDNTQTSRKLIRMFDASPTLKFTSTVNNYKEGEKKIKSENSYALIVIPRDFEKNLFKGNSVNVICYYNGQYILAGSLINSAFQTVASTFSAGVHLQTLNKKGQMPSQAMANTVPIKIDEHILFNPYTNYSYYLNIALMPMALQIVIMVVSIYVLGNVLKYNNGNQLLEQGCQNIWVVYWGKILPYTLVFTIIGFFMNSLLFYYIKIPLQGSFFAINLFFLCFIVVCQFMSIFFVSISKDLRSALTFGGGFAALSFSFTGYTFPAMGMPIVVQYINYIFPFTSYLRLIVDYAIRGISFNHLELNYYLAFGIFIIIGFLSIYKYRILLKKGGYHA
ncbi:ABC transporter permease [Apibacter muscae]|uniref:ABC transporter permease n=1 Tax=Apibacter muscae TaxID=2509004 RepID=UPI001FE4F227|nr:ABC transporter permease [Apibacter muscae]